MSCKIIYKNNSSTYYPIINFSFEVTVSFLNLNKNKVSRMEVFTISTILMGIVGILYLYMKNVYSYWERKGVPYIKPEFFYGNSREIGKTKPFSQVFAEFYQEYKKKEKFVGIYLAFRPALFLTDLDLIKAVLIKDFHSFPNRGSYFNEKDDFLSGKLVA